MLSRYIVLAIAMGGGVLAAAEPEPAVPSQTFRRVPLIEAPLSGAPGRTVTIYRGEYPPGWDSGWHVHPGDLFMYVLEGEMAVEFRDGAPARARAGETLHEPARVANRARNASGDTPVKAVVMHVGPTGEPIFKPLTAADSP